MNGIVVFFEPCYKTKTVKEIARTEVLDYSDALYIYAETPNPASQLIKFEGVVQQKAEEARLNRNIKNP